MRRSRKISLIGRGPLAADDDDNDDDETRKCASIYRPRWTSTLLGCSSSFLDRADQELVLEHQRDGDEDEVEEEHGEPEALVHPPLETGDAQDDEQQHTE